MDYKVAYENWLSVPTLSAEETAELEALTEKEKEYRFGAELAFGTAGMRGIIGAGTNMMNVYTVRRAAFGLAEYIKSLGMFAKQRGVAISYDTRKYSELFARAAAGVLVYEGIKVYIYPKPRPVPMLSFAVRKLGCISGIMITASHNPKEYNGFKVYGEDGAQMSPEATAVVVEHINSVSDYFSVKSVEVPSFSLKKEISGVNLIGFFTEFAYFRRVLKQGVADRTGKKFAKKLKLVYTPLHGTGAQPVCEILSWIGVKPITVPEQMLPDENFSTVVVPNPEEKEALSRAIALAEKIGADVVIGTDPDSDRMGVAIPAPDGKFVALTGNQTGVLLLDYILRSLKAKNELPSEAFVVKSFVSTVIAKYIAEDYGVKMIEVPVGFKYIGEQIKLAEESGKGVFVFGFEESCGYLRGGYVRDKDAVEASMLFTEFACKCAADKQSIYSVLENLYTKYGYVLDITVARKFEGIDGMVKMNAVVDKLRGNPPTSFGVFEITERRDYLNGKAVDGNGEKPLETAINNSLYYLLDNGSFVCLRPSGTEPKLKTYYSVRAKDREHAERSFEEIRAAFDALIDG